MFCRHLRLCSYPNPTYSIPVNQGSSCEVQTYFSIYCQDCGWNSKSKVISYVHDLKQVRLEPTCSTCGSKSLIPDPHGYIKDATGYRGEPLLCAICNMQ